eukprot:5023304-Amphidinium_carterae.1
MQTLEAARVWRARTKPFGVASPPERRAFGKDECWRARASKPHGRLPTADPQRLLEFGVVWNCQHSNQGSAKKQSDWAEIRQQL